MACLPVERCRQKNKSEQVPEQRYEHKDLGQKKIFGLSERNEYLGSDGFGEMNEYLGSTSFWSMQAKEEERTCTWARYTRKEK